MKPAPKLLLVEDDREHSSMLREVLDAWGYDVAEVDSGEEAIRRGEREKFDLVLSDIRMGNIDGLQVLGAFRRLQPDALVVMMTGFGSVDTAVEALGAGAFDYISKPFKFDEIKLILSRALEQREASSRERGRSRNGKADEEWTIVGHSRAMAEVYKTIARVAAGKSTVLIQGESGTGKELVARAIHKHGDRRDKPFIAINCASVPDALLESELFGYMQGAHSTAVADKPGVLELASGGILFLDEVGDMSLALQSKLLRVLEESESRRLGGTKAIQTDVRIIAATNKELAKLIGENRFRADLYYRLKVVTFILPPLRERKEDIPALADHFIRKFNALAGKNVQEVSPEALAGLQAYSWPGNVRELENLIERLIILSNKSRILADDLPDDIRANRSGNPTLSLEQTERRHILSVLEETRGNIKAAAALLGIDRKTLYRKLAEYEIQVPRE